jgi:hypothetical protein
MNVFAFNVRQFEGHPQSEMLKFEVCEYNLRE